MSTKTITVTKDAYEALKNMKEDKESFTDTILRISKRKSLSSFYGVLSKSSADKLERNIKEFRNIRNKSHSARLKNISTRLK